MKAAFLAAFAAVTMGACASTPSALEQPQYGTSFEVADNYQAVLRNIAAGTRECAAAQLLPLGQQINDTQHYPDLREGKIILGASGVGTQIVQVIEVTEPAPDTARVTVYTKAAASREAFVDNARRWATGDLSCR